MFGAHEKGGLLKAHTPFFGRLSIIIRQFKFYKYNHIKLNRSKGKR
jgi:hypothetical protein